MTFVRSLLCCVLALGLTSCSGLNAAGVAEEAGGALQMDYGQLLQGFANLSGQKIPESFEDQQHAQSFSQQEGPAPMLRSTSLSSLSKTLNAAMDGLMRIGKHAGAASFLAQRSQLVDSRSNLQSVALMQAMASDPAQRGWARAGSATQPSQEQVRNVYLKGMESFSARMAIQSALVQHAFPKPQQSA
jgi:hypothetical protein